MQDSNDEEYIVIDTEVKQNQILEDKNPDMELFEEYDKNVDEEEE